MKIHSNIAAAFAAVVITASAFAAAAASAAGTWKWSQQGRNGNTEVTAKLEVAGDKVTGSVSGPQGDTPISGGTLKDGTIAFSVERSFNDMKFVTKYSGKVEGDKITGTVERPGRDGGAPTSTPWAATRAK